MLFSGLCIAQSYEITRYADDSGLPSRIVRDVIQDANGFIWVAGNNGLYRFDGEHFKPYLSSLTDTTGLRDNKINTIAESKDGKLWIGTPRGVHILENEKISYVPIIDNPTENEEYILNIYEDKNQNIWIATYGGVFLIEPGKEAIHFLTEEDGKAVARGTVWAITEDNSANIWAATNDGYYLRNAENQYGFHKVELLLNPSLNVKDIGYYNIKQYNDSLFLLDTSHGLLKGKRFENALSIEQFLDEKGEQIGQFSVERSIIDSNGKIWIGTWKNDLKKFNIIESRLVEETIVSSNGFKEMSGTTHSVYEDSQHNIWAANTNGLFKLSYDDRALTIFPPYGCSLDLYGIYAMHEDAGGNIWVTTPTKLFRFKKDDLLKNNCPTDFLSFSDKNMQLARYLLVDTANRLWVGADGGLFVAQLDAEFNPGKFRRFTTKDGLPHDTNNRIYEVAKDSFWVGNNHGLVQLNLKDGTLKNPSIKIYTANENEPNSLVNSQTHEIGRDGDGNLWFGTFSGLSTLVNPSENGYFKNYTSEFGDQTRISNNSIKNIFKDSKNHLWIATQRGLNLYQAEDDTFLQFGHAEGLPSEYILGISEDSDGYLWICTTNGVLRAKYNPLTARFVNSQHYTVHDGLADNIPYRNSILIDDEDNVFIGSRDGISVFKADKSRLEAEQGEFAMKITEIQSTKKKEIGFSSAMHKLQNGGLVLPFDENSLKIKYVVLDYVKPENNRYRHKLLPTDDQWIEAGKNPEIYYYNLNPGDYELVLDAANSRGIWSNAPIVLKIKIKPPFWKSGWAISIYLLLTMLLIWYVDRSRIRKKQKIWQQKVALETAVVNEREQLRKENAADFHDELGSMVTKISMFLTMAERSLEESKDPKPFFQKIRDNAKGLSSGFRDLLWVIDPQKDSLADTFLRLKEFGEDLFEQSNIDFKTSEFKEDFTVKMLNPKIKKQVVMIFKEAMNNCFKYCNGSEAVLTLMVHHKFFRMEFFDNGSGFDLTKKSKGRGLKNMKTRAESIGAGLQIISSKDGTHILLDRIPHMGDEFPHKDT